MHFVLDILFATLVMLLQASPYILLGLVVAGLVHVLVPESLVLRWMGRPGLSGVARAGLIGLPLPVCSCGVVPISVELRRKGATKPATKSFLITTPESSLDSIFLTWGLMGPLMAVARPIAAFFTALLAGVFSIAADRDEEDGGHRAPRAPSEGAAAGSADPAHDRHHHHGHNHGALAYAHGSRARAAVKEAMPRLVRPRPSPGGDEPGTDPRVEDASASEEIPPRLWPDVFRPAFSYGFVELLDDLAFWLFMGLAAAGVLTAILPDDLGALGLGAGLLPMVLLLAVAVPLYTCASASTPIAAALLAKGVSPGAALVFLLAGPATSFVTVMLLASSFGRRFVQVYLASVVVGALTAGLALDAFVGTSGGAFVGIELPQQTGFGLGSVLAAVVLAALLVWRLARGAWRRGVAELTTAWRLMRGAWAVPRGWSRRRLLRLAVGAGLALYVLSGLRVVPQDSQGFGFLFGALRYPELGPGLHYVPPAPFGAWEVRRTAYARKSDVGFRTDLDQLANRQQLARYAAVGEWHSPVAAMNADPVAASYLTGDENLVEMSFSVHYFLADPAAFFFGADHRHDFVNLYAETVARELVAGMRLDELLTTRRAELEKRIAEGAQESLDGAGVGVRIRSIQIVDVHPPGGAVYAFRDVSSAREDRETQIHRAHEQRAAGLPRARGRAARTGLDAEARAVRLRLEAGGDAESFVARAEAFGRRPDLLRHLLWLETAERVLAGREIFILPPGTPSRGITLWRDEPSPPVRPRRREAE